MSQCSEKHILFVSEKFPWPLDDGGQIRTYQVLKALATRFRVLLISKSPRSPELEIPIRELGVDVLTVSNHRHWWTTSWGLIIALFTRRPFPLPTNFSGEILRVVRDQIASGKVAVLHLNHLDAAQYVHWLTKANCRPKFVFDTHNVLTTLYGRLVKSEARWIHKAYCWMQWRKMEPYEKSVMDETDCVIVCSEVERRLLSEWGIRNCLVVPNGVDIASFEPGVAPRDVLERPPNVVFVGAMDYLPNADGVRWFLDSVDTDLRRRFPSYKLTVVGKNPPPDLLSMSQAGRIEFTGRVDDVRPYLRSADIFVVPLKIGGGTRLKILEALAMELPVVATSVGAEGLELTDRTHLRIVESGTEMALALQELWDQHGLAREMAKCGRMQVCSKYTWSQSIVPLREYYEREFSGK